jgi:MIP family channel proteins
MFNLLRKLTAEFLGTFAFVFVGAGAICTDAYLVSTGQSGLGWLGIAIATGLSFGVMASALAHISGGHLNPAITIGFWVTRRLSTLHTITYGIAQFAGAIAAAYAIKLIVPDSTWTAKALGSITPDLGGDFTRAHGIALEAVLTFSLVLVVFATSVDTKGARSKVGGLCAGLIVTAGTLWGGPFTGAAMNPARALGPALAMTHWQNHGVYWAGPLLGGVVAAFLYDRVFLRDQPPAQP